MKLYFKIWVKPTPESKSAFVGSTGHFEYPTESGDFRMPEDVVYDRWRLIKNWLEAYPQHAETATFEYKLYREVEKT